MEMSTSSLLTALEAWMDNRVLGIHTSVPGIVESYDEDTRTAVVLPAINFKIPRGPVLKHTPISNVPVMFPSSQGFQLTFKIQAGDGVILIFSESSMGNWMNGGGQVDPEDSTRFSMHDAIAIPGLWSVSKVPKLPVAEDFLLASATGVQVGGHKDGTIALRNEITSLKAELETLRNSVKAIRTDLAPFFSAGQAASTGPLAPLQPAFAAGTAANLAAMPQFALDTAALGRLLK